MDRFYLLQDESAHWYLVPVSKADRFRELLEADGDLDAFNNEFSEMSLGGSPTRVSFTDPRMD